MNILTSFSLDSKKKTRINFGGGEISSDGGLFLVNEFVHKLGFIYILKNEFHTTDTSGLRRHKDPENLLQMIYQIISVY